MKKHLLVIPMLCLAASPSLQVSAAETLAMSVQQQKGNTIQGTVVDQNGEPIIGASVRVKGGKHGTVTDLDGHFTLENANGTVEISYIGFKPQILKNPRGATSRLPSQKMPVSSTTWW